MDNYEIDKALKQIFDLLSLTNTYIDSQEPWNLKKIDLDRMNIVLSVSVEIIRRASILLFPVIPKSIEKIISILNMKTQILKLKYEIRNLKTELLFPIGQQWLYTARVAAD